MYKTDFILMNQLGNNETMDSGNIVKKQWEYLWKIENPPKIQLQKTHHKYSW